MALDTANHLWGCVNTLYVTTLDHQKNDRVVMEDSFTCRKNLTCFPMCRLVQQRGVFVGDVEALLLDKCRTRLRWQTRMVTSVGQVLTSAYQDGHLGRSGAHVGEPGWPPRPVMWASG